MILQVKQLDEFIGRFNYVQDIYGNPITEEFSDKISREEFIRSLFDQEDPRIDMGSPEYDRGYSEKISRFISYITEPENPKYVDLNSELIFAVAESLFKLKEDDRIINLILKKEINSYSVKWVIAGVQHSLPVPAEIRDKETTITIIPPNSNETNFIALYRVFEDYEHLSNYFYSGYENENLRILQYYIQNQILKFSGVHNIVYHVLDIPGWAIIIEQFNRDTMNSGWLIADLVEVSELNTYMSGVLGVNLANHISILER